jgi:two-component system response regulator GlrR
MTQKSPPSTASLGFGMTQRTKPTRGRKEEVAPQPQRKARIVLVDPDPESRRLMTSRLTNANYDVDALDTAQAALDACVRSRPNLVITDLRMPGMDGLELLKEVKSRWPPVMVIIVTAHGTIPEAVRATQSGAFGFLVKPVERSELLGQVQRGIESSTFTLVDGDWRSALVARSQLMKDRLELANRAAASDIPVLLTGENGTGKELLARAIHASSARRGKPFITVRCKDVDEASLEVQLFGARGAADPGGAAPGPGAVAAAAGGTLLLDEIGHLPPRLQSELMAVLRKHSTSAYGYAPSEVGPRLISTTSRDLKELSTAGEFRPDLLYQINILPIEIPPLGRRREDIPLLVSHFLEQATEPGGKQKIYSPEAIELLATTDWPGNVRQLFDLVKQNVALSHNKIMSKEFVERSLGEAAKKVPTYDEARESFARSYLEGNLQATSGNISQAARLAKRNRTDFYKLLARYRVEPNDFKNPGDGKPDAAGAARKPDAGD